MIHLAALCIYVCIHCGVCVCVCVCVAVTCCRVGSGDVPWRGGWEEWVICIWISGRDIWIFHDDAIIQIQYMVGSTFASMFLEME